MKQHLFQVEGEQFPWTGSLHRNTESSCKGNLMEWFTTHKCMPSFPLSVWFWRFYVSHRHLSLYWKAYDRLLLFV
jgi:hypothetical protein